MEKNLVLKTDKREHTGKKAAQQVRKQSQIPAIVYGHKEEPVSISVDKHDFTEGIHHGRRLMELKIGRKKEIVIVKDLQYDYLGKDIIHADLMRVSESERVEVNVPIEIKGTAKGAGEGGIIEEQLGSLEVECMVTEIPEKFVVRVNNLDIGDNLHAGDIELPQGVKLITDPETVVVTCRMVTVKEVVAEAEEEPTAPEVIGEEKEEPEQKKEQQ
ncbi:MAG: 50S ribosomal protein L25 [Sedimentisphaerales bacterium]|nr:50S ribosomal protein L25 [Sedimentisphaerales bacterium]